MKVKLCGFTRAEDIAEAIVAGADAIGLNIARGPRRIGIEQAAALARAIPPPIGTVVVTVDQDEEDILAAVAATRADTVQLHGDEPPELAERLRRRVRVLRALRVRTREDLALAAGYPCDALLLDAWSDTAHGGTGRRLDPSLLDGWRSEVPWLLAGGLTPANVAAAIAATHPFGVDCASGIERAPGIKDGALMQAFVAAATGSTLNR